MAISRGLVVKALDIWSRGRGFESRRILDGFKRFASYYIKRKIENKCSQMGHTKKNIKKKKKKIQYIYEGIENVSQVLNTTAKEWNLHLSLSHSHTDDT